MKGANHNGVPKGRNWPKNLKVLNVNLDKIIVNHVNQAALIEKIMWTVDGKKYGFILKILRNKIEKNNDKIKEEINFKKNLLEFLNCWNQ